MRAEEVRELSVTDIEERIAALEEERFRLKFRSATETLENPLRLRALRRDVARLKSVLREKTGDTRAAARGARRQER